ncbi:molybdenum ABC transporter ATP-binding protein [Pelagicoccus mobilis]|uniref:Molybdenum ABC transporter ATP-binding protein n=1 Tax=Pelagicoccus mobilis TaxID=415221 RepID=A0A934VS64_9BACT|nr:molybdenum ABC transporter ATP-binding protein [Pelagicoccus mobilis]MBK1878690.1 molybdenum ABC transporter ATP-binding protein [Pelagicoccus mobilis]
MSTPVLDLSIQVELDQFNLDLIFSSSKRTIGIFGPSGSGKTTLLESLAGLRGEAKGKLVCLGETWLDSSANVALKAEQRAIGYVPQDHLLFPHWNVRQNLESGSKRARQSGEDTESVFSEVVQTLELAPLLDRNITELSGGERQRVSLGRALCSGPKLLILDEPLASLDWKLRHRILPYLVRIRDTFKIPLLIVSHNPAELLALCDEVVALNRGKKVAQGTPTDVFSTPEVYAAAADEGFENIVRGEVVQSSNFETQIRLEGSETEQLITVSASHHTPGEKVLLGIRSQDVLLSNNRIQGVSARNWIEAKTQKLSQVDGKQVLIAKAGRNEFLVELTQDAVAELKIAPENRIWLFFKSSAVSVYSSTPSD